MFAAELRATGEFIGFISLDPMGFAIPGVAQPAVEIGWRLARAYWGKGLATEGARAVSRYAFDTLRLKEIVAITVPANIRSRRVMEKSAWPICLPWISITRAFPNPTPCAATSSISYAQLPVTSTPLRSAGVLPQFSLLIFRVPHLLRPPRKVRG